MNRNYTYARSFVTFNSIPNSIYFLQKYNIPGFTIGSATQTTPYQNVPLPGDKVSFNDFNATFILDENMSVFIEMWDWISSNNTENYIGDFSLHIFNNTAKNFVLRIDFIGGWISQMNEIQFVDSTTSDDTNPRLLDCLFKYAYYTPVKITDQSNYSNIIEGVE